MQTLRAMVKRKMATSSCCVLSPPACNKSIVDIKFHIDKILYFLDSFGWLADVYVSVTISFSLHFLYFNFKVLETPCKDCNIMNTNLFSTCRYLRIFLNTIIVHSKKDIELAIMFSFGVF